MIHLTQLYNFFCLLINRPLNRSAYSFALASIRGNEASCARMFHSKWKTFFTVFVFICLAPSLYSQALNDYRSIATGNWNTTGTWQRYNGTAWVAAVAVPTSTANVITIRSPHNVTLNGAQTIDQLTIESGGTFTQTANLTISNGVGTDITVQGT